MVKLVDTKDLKSLPFWECQFESGRGHQSLKLCLQKTFYLYLKIEKSVTLNNDFWSDKFKVKYNVFQFFINDNLNFSNSKIISSINEIIKLNKIDLVLFEGDHAHIINFNFIKNINKNTKKEFFF